MPILIGTVRHRFATRFLPDKKPNEPFALLCPLRDRLAVARDAHVCHDMEHMQGCCLCAHIADICIDLTICRLASIICVGLLQRQNFELFTQSIVLAWICVSWHGLLASPSWSLQARKASSLCGGGFVGQVAEFGSRSEAANADCACEEVPGAPQLCESLFSQVFEHEASGVRARAHSEVSRLKLHLFSVRERTRSS